MESRHDNQMQRENQNGAGTVIPSNSPQLIKIMADNESNKRVLCHWVSFFGFAIFFYVMTFLVPDPIIEYRPVQPLQIKNRDRPACPASYLPDRYLNSMCKPFDWDINPVLGMQKFDMLETNQFVVVQLNFTLVDGVKGSVKQNVKYKYSYYLIDEKGGIQKTVEKDSKHNFNVYCDSKNKKNEKCDERWILYIPEITFKHVMFRIEFENGKDLKQKIDLKGASFIYINNKYTNFLLAVKYSFMAISLITCIAYFWRLKKLAQAHWVIEQKFILTLSVMLIMFNDPFYALTLLNPNMAGAFFSVLWIVNFLVTLFIFWIVALKRIVEDNANKITKSFNIKLMIFGTFSWLFLLLTYVGFSYEYQQHPGTEFYEEFSTVYEVFKIMGLILFSIFLLYLFYNYFLICRVYKTRIWRHRLFSTFSLYFIFCIAIFMFTGTPHVYSSYGERVLLFICIMNMYVYYMQFMYSPSDAGLQEAQQTQDLEFPQQNQVYEMLDESIQIQELNFEYDQQQNQEQPQQQQSHQGNKERFQIDDDDDENEHDNNNQDEEQNQKYQTIQKSNQQQQNNQHNDGNNYSTATDKINADDIQQFDDEDDQQNQ